MDLETLVLRIHLHQAVMEAAGMIVEDMTVVVMTDSAAAMTGEVHMTDQVLTIGLELTIEVP